MSKARQLADLGNVYDDGALSNRNMVTNGAMLVNQRGNRSPAGFTGGFYAGPDRWYVNRSGTGATGFSQISSTSYGGTKAAEASFLCASGETYIVTQRIEADNIAHLAGQTVTLSFWASGSSDAGSATLNASLSYAGAVNDFTSETVISSNAVSYSGSAQRFTFTFTLPANAANGVAIRFDGAKTSATGTFTLTFGGVQLEAGDTPTDLEHEPISVTLQKCRRYYQNVYNRGNATTGTYYSYYNKFYGNQVQFEPMRTGPTVSYSHIGGAFYWVNPGVAAYSANSTAGFSYSTHQTNAFSMGAIEFSQVRPAGGTTPSNFASYRLEANLIFHLDAEL